MINIYTPKPSPIQAIQYTTDNMDEIMEFAGEYCCQINMDKDDEKHDLLITTEHGSSMFLPEGSYITKNCMGSFSVYNENEFKELFLESTGGSL